MTTAYVIKFDEAEKELVRFAIDTERNHSDEEDMSGLDTLENKCMAGEGLTPQELAKLIECLEWLEEATLGMEDYAQKHEDLKCLLIRLWIIEE